VQQSRTHIIRLHRAWDCAVVLDAKNRDPVSVRCTRRFGCPTGLDDQTRVLLRMRGVGAPVVVALNGREIGTIAADHGVWAGDIKRLLRPRNELTLTVDLGDHPGPVTGVPVPNRSIRPEEITGSVTLEIR